MNIKQGQTRVWLGLCSILMLLLGTLTPRPALGTGRADGLDVTRIDAFVRRQVQRHGIPGLALAVIEDDQIVLLQGYGVADASGRAVTPQTPFVLASASKPITALAVMQLVDAGVVELDAPVQRYLPSFRVADPLASQQITVRHLLQHTSGIPEQGCQSSRFGTATLEQFVAALETIELAAPVGARYFYCSGNYNVLGRIIEVVSGQSFASYIEQQVFAPLAMPHSFASEEAAKRDGLAQGYHWLFGVPMPMEYPYDVPQVPSGFLVASAEDLGHFLIAQLSGGRFGTTTILSPGGIAAMQAPGVAIGSGVGSYGLGWQTGALGNVPAVFHRGSHPNANTLMFIAPETRRGAVLLMNGGGWLPLFGTFTEIEDGVARLLAEQQLASPSSLSLGWRYLILDAVLGGLFALALLPLLRLRRWVQRWRQRLPLARWGNVRMGLRLAWEFGVPLTLLLGARLLLGALGAQSWPEGLLLFPDIGAWLWGIALLMFFTGAARLALMFRLLRHTDGQRGLGRLASSGSGRPACHDCKAWE